MPTMEQEYDTLVQFLDQLLDLPQSWKTAQVEQLIDYVGNLIEKYDEKHFAPALKTTALFLKSYMENVS